MERRRVLRAQTGIGCRSIVSFLLEEERRTLPGVQCLHWHEIRNGEQAVNRGSQRVLRASMATETA
jgi:hypothetical protein